MWRIISSREIYKHPRLTLVEDVIELPDGGKTTYLKFKDIGDAVTVVCRNAKGQILLQREYSHPIGKVLWQTPGGKIEKDEDVVDAANRELQEESGFKAKRLKVIGKYLLDNRRSKAYMHIVLAEDIEQSKLPADIGESVESHWMAVADIKQKITNQEIEHVHVLAALTLFELSNQKD